MRTITKSPTFWVVLGTITLSLGTNIVSNMLGGPIKFSTTELLLLGGAIALAVTGVTFYMLNNDMERRNSDIRAYVESEERTFLWKCNDPRQDADLLFDNYGNPALGVTKKLLLDSIGKKLAPIEVTRMFEIAAEKDVDDRIAKQGRSKCVMIFSVVVLVVAVALLILSLSFRHSDSAGQMPASRAFPKEKAPTLEKPRSKSAPPNTDGSDKGGRVGHEKVLGK